MKDTFKVLLQEHANGQRALRKEALSLKGMARHAVNMLKLSNKASGRALTLAYALLCGIPYTSLERKCRVLPDPQEIAAHAQVAEEEARAWLGQAAHRHAA